MPYRCTVCGKIIDEEHRKYPYDYTCSEDCCSTRDIFAKAGIPKDFIYRAKDYVDGSIVRGNQFTKWSDDGSAFLRQIVITGKKRKSLKKIAEIWIDPDTAEMTFGDGTSVKVNMDW